MLSLSLDSVRAVGRLDWGQLAHSPRGSPEETSVPSQLKNWPGRILPTAVLGRGQEPSKGIAQEPEAWGGGGAGLGTF